VTLQVARRLCAQATLALVFAGTAQAQQAPSPGTPAPGACDGLKNTTTPQAVTITVEPRPDEIPPRLVVTVRTPAAGRSVTPVTLPQVWAGATGFPQGVRNLRVITSGARLLDATPIECPANGGDGSIAQRIAHPPTGGLTYRYDLVEYGDPLLTEHRRFYQPLVRPDYAFFFGHAAWLLPRWNNDQRVRVQWRYTRVPADWTVATSFDATPAQPAMRSLAWAPQLVEAGNLWHSVHALGDFRLHRVDLAGRPMWIALRGRHKFDDAAFVERTAGLVRAQREFFGDNDFRHYLITLLPNGLAQGSTGGTQIFNAFAMHVPADFTVPGPSFEHLIAHENLHTWVPGRFGTMDSSPTVNDEPLRYWFSEGFTNFLTHRLLVKTGQWSLEDYARTLNTMIQRFETSEARERDNRAVLALFFKDRAVGELPYQRGELLALHWDAQLRERGSSTAAILRGLLLPRPSATDPQRQPLATERLFAALELLLGSQPRADVAALVDAAGPIPYRDTLLGPCFTMQPAEFRKFELGFAVAASIKARRLVGLVPGSAAAAAGLREGDVLKGWSIYGGDTERDAMLQVERDGKVIDITWRPVAASTVAAVRFEPRPQADADPACRRWMALQ
jgi:predicted metalloprotease with PDZ domain